MGNGDGRALVPVVLHPLQHGVSNLGRVYSGGKKMLANQNADTINFTSEKKSYGQSKRGYGKFH